MAEFNALYRCNEVHYTENMDFIKEYENNLPHGKEIVKELCDSWNKDHDFFTELANEELVRGGCQPVIADCKMREFRRSGETVVGISYVAKPNKRLSGKVKQVLAGFSSAQYCDGWGEGVFGFVNSHALDDGTFYVIE